jgi:hypothetical protein
VDAVYGSIQLDGPDLWSRLADETTWVPASATLTVGGVFNQSGEEVSRIAYLVTRDTSGLLTAALTSHADGDLNHERMTVTITGTGTQVMALTFLYDYGGLSASLSQTVSTSIASGGSGPAGPGAMLMTVDKPLLVVYAYQDGTVTSFTGADGNATVWEATNDVTAAAVFGTPTTVNCTGTVNTADNTPVAGQLKGYYRITAMTADSGTMEIPAVYNGNTVYVTIQINKVKTGIEIVSALPSTNKFNGRLVYLETDGKLYRVVSGAWTKAVDGGDVSANTLSGNSIVAGSIVAAKLAVTSLSSIAANIGTITAGLLRSASSHFKVDMDNARIILNTAPGTTGGYVRIQGYGFGPSGQYMDWYGPKPSGTVTDAQIIAGLGDSTALWFLKTDGTSLATGRIRGEFETKAWVVFDGDDTATIQDRFNVSSVARTGAGLYTIVFATALPNNNYVVAGTAHRAGTTLRFIVPVSRGTSSFSIQTRGTNDAGDSTYVGLVVFGSNVVGGSNHTTPGGGFGGGTRGGGVLP